MSRRILSFLTGLGLMLVCLLWAVYLPASSTRRFEQALLAHVDAAALQTDEASLVQFAGDTMDYLLGRAEEWKPSISIWGLRDFIPRSFTRHMATVRGWCDAIPWILGIGGAVCLCLLILCLRRGLHPSAWRWGVGLPLLLLLAAGLWALADFNGLWGFIHRTFIPDGIFPAKEPVMALFPPSLFFSYLPVVAGLAVGAALLALALPNLVHLFAKRSR